MPIAEPKEAVEPVVVTAIQKAKAKNAIAEFIEHYHRERITKALRTR